MLIFKIFRTEEWQTLLTHGQTPGAPIDVADGYIHLSTPNTATEKGATPFHAADGIVPISPGTTPCAGG